MPKPSKQAILGLIQAHAVNNGGTPLGKQRFENATGVRESDWSGVYWSKWSDALAEAGFEPNAFMTAMSDDTVLRHLAEFTRELGHFPTAPELRLRRSQDDGFPNLKVFERIGSRAVRLSRLRSFCESSDDHRDVLDLVPAASGETQPADDSVTDGESETMAGFVYLVRSGTKYKVGRTGEVERRVSELRYQSPDAIELVHSIRTDDQVGIEAYWQRRFASRRHREEWFSLTRADIAAFKLRKSFM